MQGSAFATNLFQELNSSIQLSVKKDDGATYVCSSVAITRQALLTAAHCLDHAKEIYAHDVLSGNKIQATFFRAHPKYQKALSNYRYDVGVIVLAFQLSPQIQLHSLLTQLNGDEVLFRVGFGGRENQNKMTIISPITHFRSHAREFLGGGFIEMYDQYSYSGDSGGPVFAQVNGKIYLVGIHSTKQGSFSFNPMVDREVYNWLSSL